MKELTTNEALEILKKYDHNLYEYYMNNSYAIGFSMRLYAEKLRDEFEKPMTRAEMIKFAREHPGVKFTHPLFMDNEYIYSNGWAFYDENDRLFESWDDSDRCAIGLRMRAVCNWLYDWRVKELNDGKGKTN